MRGWRLPASIKLGAEDSQAFIVEQYRQVKVALDPESPWNDLIHIPNERKSSRLGGWLKNMTGRRKGFLDYFLMHGNSAYHGLILELKIKPNKVTKEQQWWLDRAQKKRYCSAVAWSADEFISIVEAYIGFK